MTDVCSSATAGVLMRHTRDNATSRVLNRLFIALVLSSVLMGLTRLTAMLDAPCRFLKNVDVPTAERHDTSLFIESLMAVNPGSSAGTAFYNSVWVRSTRVDSFSRD